MPSVLESIENGLLQLLAPMTKAGGGPLVNIVVADFFGPADLESVMQNEGAGTPCGILSLGGEGVFDTEQNRRVGVMQQTDVAYRYLFSMVDANAETTKRRASAVYSANDLFVSRMSDAEMGSFAPTDWAFWPVRLIQSQKLNTPKFIAFAWSFDVRVRSCARATI